ncbi:uncharacterized protein LOC144060620 [Vanacampus margaritifer]
MFLLLVVTATVSLLPGATYQSDPQHFDLTECPINYYGETYNEAFGLTTENVFTLFFGIPTGPDFMTFAFENPVQLGIFGPSFIVANENSEFVQNLPDLVGTSPCSYAIDLIAKGPISFAFRTFGKQGAYATFSSRPLVVNTTVSGQLVSTTQLSAGETYAHLSGCMIEGQFYAHGTEMCDL